MAKAKDKPFSVNGFEPIPNTDTTNQPPHLTEMSLSPIKGFRIFNSSFDKKIYVVYNPSRQSYSSHRYSGEITELESNVRSLVAFLFRTN